RLIFSDPQAPPDRSDFPFVLLTGRGSSAQWHTLTRSGKSPVLRQLSPKEACVEVNPTDAKELQLQTGDRARVRSAQGIVVVEVVVTNAVAKGQVFMSMHSELTNKLTFPSVDPFSRQPSYKFTKVQLSRIPS